MSEARFQEANDDALELIDERTWRCPACTFENEESYRACEMCGHSKRPRLEAPPAAQESDIGSGDRGIIRCEACTYINAAEADESQRCMMCDALLRGNESDATGGDHSEGFNCELCTCWNEPGARRCVACGGDSSGVIEGRGYRSGPGMAAELLTRDELISQLEENGGDVGTTTAGLLPLLSQCLSGAATSASGSGQRTPPQVLLVSPQVPHVSQPERWSCGYRNIQMLCRSLIAVPAFAEALFGGVAARGPAAAPSVLGIQQWIELAWADGFDPEGCEQLGGRGSLVGSTTWIGATECACLLRYFGVRAEVYDFEAALLPIEEAQKRWNGNVPGRGRGRGSAGRSPNFASENSPGKQPLILDYFGGRGGGRGGGGRGSGNGSGRGSGGGGISGGGARPAAGAAAAAAAPAPAAKAGGAAAEANERKPSRNQRQACDNRAILDWIWNYLSVPWLSLAGNNINNADSGGGEIDTSNIPENFKPPLYLQHNGHSRTVVGMERVSANSVNNLLIFDPAQRGDALEAALRSQRSWQRFVKRGAHTLRRKEHQIVCVLPGLMTPRERAAAKVIHSHKVTSGGCAGASASEANAVGADAAPVVWPGSPRENSSKRGGDLGGNGAAAAAQAHGRGFAPLGSQAGNSRGISAAGAAALARAAAGETG